MSCYFRHMRSVLDEAGVEVTSANKKRIDRAIHELVGVGYKDCPSTWKALKQQVLNDDEKKREFIDKLRDALG